MHSGLTMSEGKIVNGVDDDGSVKDETNLHLWHHPHHAMETARKRVKNYEFVNTVYDLWALHPQQRNFPLSIKCFTRSPPTPHTATFTFSFWCNIKSLNVSMNVKKRRLTSNMSEKCMQRACRESSMIEIHALLLRCASPTSSHRLSMPWIARDLLSHFEHKTSRELLMNWSMEVIKFHLIAAANATKTVVGHRPKKKATMSKPVWRRKRERKNIGKVIEWSCVRRHER